jgi:hypothetical protein
MLHDIIPSQRAHATPVSGTSEKGRQREAHLSNHSHGCAGTGPLRQLLRRMQAEALVARRDPIDPHHVILVRSSVRGSLSAGRAPRSLIDEGLRAGCLVKSTKGSISVAEGLDMAAERLPATRSDATPRVNDAESPLLWLHRRKGADGQPLLDEAGFLAGERFRRDVTQAAMLPSVTTNWSRMESSSSRALPRDPALASDVTIAARQRVRAVFRLLGSDMGHFMLDVCAFLVPLQEAEARRAWPARSGKLVLRMALSQLATHYGIVATASGPAVGTINGWQHDPQRLSMQAWLSQPDMPS